MAAMIMRIKTSCRPGLWTLSSKYLFAGSQLQASQKRYFGALGYRPLKCCPDLLAISRMNKSDPKFSSQPFKAKLKELIAFRHNPELLKYQQKIGDVIKRIDRNNVKRFLKIIGPMSVIFITLAYLRGRNRQKLITEIEAEKESIRQKLQEEKEEELKHKKPNASQATPFSKVFKKDDSMQKDYALPSFTSAPKEKKDLINSDSLYMPHIDMQQSDEIRHNSKFHSPKNQVEANVATVNDDLSPCLDSSPHKDVQKTEDAVSKTNEQKPCLMPSPCKDSKKLERSKSHSLITSEKSSPFKGVQKSADILPLKGNYQSPFDKSLPCKDKSEVVASKSNHHNPRVKSPSSRDVPKTEDLHKAKEWSLTKCSHIKTPPGINLGVNSAVENESHDASNVAPCIDIIKSSPNESNLTPCSDIIKSSANGSNLTPCSDIIKSSANESNLTPCSDIIQSSANESNLTPCSDIIKSSANESNLTLAVDESKSADGTCAVTTLPCTEPKQVDNSKGLNKPKRLIRFSSPEKPVKENHNNAPEVKTPKIHFKQMQSEETVNNGANTKILNSPQNINKAATEPISSDLTAKNISQNNATSGDGPNGGDQAGSLEMVCTVNPEEIEMDLSTTTNSNKSAANPDREPKKGLAVNKSPIGNFMKKDCAKPEKVEKKLCLKSTFKEKDKSLEKDTTNYKRREVIEVNDKVCVDDK